MSYTRLAEGLEQQVQSSGKLDNVDATNLFQMMFENADRHIVNVKVLDGNSVLIVLGLRSEILSPFPKFKETKIQNYSPCDIPSLVPGIALTVGSSRKQISSCMIQHGENTRFILGFEGKDLRTVARNIWRFMERWDRWKEVLLNILEKDVPFEIDWREFLAGQSGYVTMDWYTPLSFQSRTNALIKVVQASKALLQSVLSSNQMEELVVRDFVQWLDQLRPLRRIECAQPLSMEGEV